jgi:phosphoglycerate dehydrogenase-like enzyme
MSTGGELLVYVENKAGRDPAYAITQDAWDSVMPADLPVKAVFHLDSRPNLPALEQADVFVGSGFDTERLRLHASRLKVVHCTSAGIDKYLPLDWLPAAACLTNSSGIHSDKAREYALMALLMLATRLPKHFSDQRHHRWNPFLSGVAAGHRVLIVGLGHIGCAVAAAARILQMHVSAVTRHGRANPEVDRIGTIDRIHDFLVDTDILVLCCPLTEETRGLIGEKELACLPAGAGIINMARGPILRTQPLLEALSGGQLAGAVLDVFDAEPLPAESGLWDAPNVIITPHVSCDIPSGYTKRSLQILKRNLIRLAKGDTNLENAVSRSRGY